MSSNDPRPETPANNPPTTTTAPTAANTATTTNRVQLLSSQALSPEELSQLERDMQLKDPKDVVLPGGHTLQQVLDVQREHQEQAAREALEKVEKGEVKLPATSSTVMTTKSVLAVSDDGHLVTVPLSPPNAETDRKVE